MQEALAWVGRQQKRHAEGAGFSFTIARRTEEFAIGHCGLWLKDLDEEQASAGYAVAPSERGRGYAAEALAALTEFGWTVPGVQPRLNSSSNRGISHRFAPPNGQVMFVRNSWSDISWSAVNVAT